MIKLSLNQVYTTELLKMTNKMTKIALNFKEASRFLAFFTTIPSKHRGFLSLKIREVSENHPLMGNPDENINIYFYELMHKTMNHNKYNF